jgi:hypothetical protein
MTLGDKLKSHDICLNIPCILRNFLISNIFLKKLSQKNFIYKFLWFKKPFFFIYKLNTKRVYKYNKKTKG